MPTFQDSEGLPPIVVVPEGDYTLTVWQFKTDLSSGSKTRGCPRYNIVFNIDGHEAQCREQLIDHPSCAWKIDTFLKSCGIRKLPKGQDFEFNKEEAEERGVPWVNPMGLRCHAQLIQDTYTNASGKEYTNNKVSIYYTDKPILPPDPILRQKATE